MDDESITLDLGNGVRLCATALTDTPHRVDAPLAEPCVLSRFARFRFAGESLVLESPASDWQVELSGAAAVTALARLATPVSAANDDLAGRLAAALATFDMVVPGDLTGAPVEPAERDSWEHHDLALHRASRLEHAIPACGGRGNVDPATVPPALPPVRGRVLKLPLPDPDTLRTADVPFFDVVETRQSGRSHGPRVITANELAEFLYRTSRVTWTAEDGGLDTAGRPYPSGGGAYELDVYCLVGQCEGIDPGLYRYVADQHAIEVRCEADEVIEDLRADAQAGAGMPTPPQIVVTLVSRFARLSRRYEGLAYALTLKNVGVVMQTMCLTATAMGLSACPLGTGNSERFAAAAGNHALDEPAVGELVLGATS